MKLSKKVRTFLCAVLAVGVLTAFAAMAGGGAGSQTDPLVTLSYLTETFTDQIMDKLDGLLAQRNTALTKELADRLAQLPDGTVVSRDAYRVVTLSAGQALSGEAGCEVVLYSGAARCTGEGSTGLIDATSGNDLANEAALTANHLYLMPESRTITTVNGATLLARGTYTVA